MSTICASQNLDFLQISLKIVLFQISLPIKFAIFHPLFALSLITPKAPNIDSSII